MTSDERQEYAMQILSNPLFAEIWDQQETSAVDVMVYAKDDISRQSGALRVQAIRSFRQDCEAMLRNTRVGKGAPA